MSEPSLGEYRYITQVPGVCGGRPVIKGTRLDCSHHITLERNVSRLNRWSEKG